MLLIILLLLPFSFELTELYFLYLVLFIVFAAGLEIDNEKEKINSIFDVSKKVKNSYIRLQKY